jgi:crotonobetainyl-CoA:carnitine CoA-transferase CaiB-like acyl-CoA transferase
MKGTPWEALRAPLLGEHTNEVLGGLGLSPGDIEILRGEGVV